MLYDFSTYNCIISKWILLEQQIRIVLNTKLIKWYMRIRHLTERDTRSIILDTYHIVTSRSHDPTQ